MPKPQHNYGGPPSSREMFEYGLEIGATHMFIVGDGDPCDIGPSYVMPDGEDGIRIENLCWIAGHVLKAYNLSVPYDEQSGTYNLYEFWAYPENCQDYYEESPIN